MASKVLKGLTIEICGDTTKLNKALDGIENQSANLNSELKNINSLLKFDPKNTELLAQKQKVLADSIVATEEKLGILREAEKQVQAQFEKGKASEAQVRALQREIIAAEQKLDRFHKEAKDTAETVEDLGKETKGASDDVEDLGDEAQDAEKKTGDLGGTLEKGLAVGLGAVAAATVGAIAGIKSVVEETAEYRNAMAKLDTSFEDSGHSSEAAYETYAELQSILGETDQALEAASFISQLADNEADLTRWTKAATGVYAKFGAALPIEGLTEAANETAKVGQVTGPFADALNWAAKEGETFGVVLKEATEENEAWNTAVMEAASAEDYFNLALQECSSEQERQTLILETLEGMYSETADTYRETNKEVIAQNKATERMNKAWAKIGEKAAPIVTTFTEGIADLVEAFMELIDDVDLDPLINGIKNGFKYITKNVLPKLIDALEWVAENFDLIKAAAMGFIAALATKKIASFASTVAGPFVKALVAGTAKQHLMNAAANANPYVLLATAIIGVATAIGSYLNSQLEEAKEAAREAAEEAYGLSEAELQLTERASEAAEAFRNQRKAMDESISSTVSQFSHISSLKDELLKLADADGKVDEKNRARAQFIIGELNNALGTEYSLTDGQIEKYKELAGSIDEVILKKKTEILLEAGADAYAQAIRNKQQTEEDYYNSVIALQDMKAEGLRLDREAEELNREAEEAFWAWEKIAVDEKIALHNEETRVFNENYAKKAAAMKESKTALEGYYSDIGQYETAQRLMLEGNTEEAQKVMADRSYYMEQYADKVGFESEEIMNSWELQATEAGISAATLKDNWEKGVNGYTKEMVDEAEEGYNAAVGAMDNAYNDAYGVGTDIDDGMVAGMESGRSSVVSKISSIVGSAISAARKAADSHSPSRKMISLGEDMDDGLEVGLDKNADGPIGAAEKQVEGILNAYDGLRAPAGQMSLRQLAGAESARQTASQTALASTNSGVLDKILAAIERGQVITIDGDTLVGATADRMDNALGSRRALSARGAI